MCLAKSWLEINEVTAAGSFWKFVTADFLICLPDILPFRSGYRIVAMVANLPDTLFEFIGLPSFVMKNGSPLVWVSWQAREQI